MTYLQKSSHNLRLHTHTHPETFLVGPLQNPSENPQEKNR